MDVNIKLDIRGTEKYIKKAANQAPFAAMRATNDVLFEARNRLVEVEANKYLENVTRWTTSRRAMMVTKARNKRSIYANIYIPEERKYLEWLIFGGKSVPYKNGQTNLVEPADGRLNRYKNIPRTYVGTRKAKDGFFVGKPKNSNRPYGLYQRKNNGSAPKLHVFIERKSRYQRSIFPADDLARKYIKSRFEPRFRIQFQRALKTMR